MDSGSAYEGVVCLTYVGCDSGQNENVLISFYQAKLFLFLGNIVCHPISFDQR